MSMKRKKIGHEQGVSVQLSIIGQFFLDAPQTKLSRHISARKYNTISYTRRVF